MTGLEYRKLILRKVSFSEGLFKKELTKSKSAINVAEIKELILWCIVEFGSLYPHVIMEKMGSDEN